MYSTRNSKVLLHAHLHYCLSYLNALFSDVFLYSMECRVGTACEIPYKVLSDDFIISIDVNHPIFKDNQAVLESEPQIIIFVVD